MCTSTVADVEVAWPQPLIAMVLVTVVLSGMVTSVPLVPEQPGGGGSTVPVPVKSSRFGEPVPGLVTLFGVALATIASRICAGVHDGFCALSSAAAPATCGDA